MNPQYYVQVLDLNGTVVKEIVVAGEHSAKRVESGMNINLNHEKYWTRIVQKESS